MQLTTSIEAAEDGTFAIVLQVEGSGPGVTLQSGYSTVQEALEAFIDCLTTAPPDLEPYDLAVNRVTDLVNEIEEIVDAIGQLGTRMNEVEDRLAGTGPAQPPAGKRSLLPGRDVARGPIQQPVRQAPPPLKRTKDRPEGQQGLAQRVHGQLFGGPSRRGAAMQPQQEEPSDD